MKRHLGDFLPLLLCLATLLFPLGASAQNLVFDLTVSGPEGPLQVLSFGLADGAAPGLDGYDVPSPPPVPEAALNGYLSMLTPPDGLPNRWLGDFRPLLNFMLTRIEFWTLTLADAQPGSVVTLAVDLPGGTTIPYVLWIHGPGNLSQEMNVPGSLEIPVTDPTMIFFWELRLDDQVAAEPRTWGGVKSLFR